MTILLYWHCCGWDIFSRIMCTEDSHSRSFPSDSLWDFFFVPDVLGIVSFPCILRGHFDFKDWCFLSFFNLEKLSPSSFSNVVSPSFKKKFPKPLCRTPVFMSLNCSYILLFFIMPVWLSAFFWVKTSVASSTLPVLSSSVCPSVQARFYPVFLDFHPLTLAVKFKISVSLFLYCDSRNYKIALSDPCPYINPFCCNFILTSGIWQRWWNIIHIIKFL